MNAPQLQGEIVTRSLERTRMPDGKTGREEIERVNRQVRAFVAEKPLMAVLLALTTGYVVGRIISRVS